MYEKPLSVGETANLTGITVRTLHYYDQIGLLKPSVVTDTKYRQYTQSDLSRLQEILFFREVGFSLKEIKKLLYSPDYSRQEALEKHLQLLEAQKERLEDLITLVNGEIQGTKEPSFAAFSHSKILDLQAQFREEIIRRWGKTEPFLEYEAAFPQDRPKEQQETFDAFLAKTRDLLQRLAMYEDKSPGCTQVQEIVKEWQDYITRHFYQCDHQMLARLGELYVSDTRFSGFINRFGSSDLAEYFNRAIRIYTGSAGQEE